MFPGVVPAPFAMVKVGPDVENGAADAYSGYLPAGNITGFSLMHESGTGGAPKYGVVNQMPVVGAVDNPLVDLAQPRAAEDYAEVGYYKTSLGSGVVIEVAGTNHAGFYQYTLPAGENSVVVDVSHVLPSFRGLGWGQGYAGGSFELLNGSSYQGSGTYNNGWNRSPNWNVYFCGYFDQEPTASRTFTGNDTTIFSYDDSSTTNGTLRQGGVFTFNETRVTSRVGVSMVSTEQACNNVASEIPAGTQLGSLVNQSKSLWNNEALGKVTTTETNSTVLTQLYSYLYGMLIIPSNRTGENPLWTSNEPYYDDFFTFWDLFRCSTPLMHVLQPVPYEEMIRSVIDIAGHEGGWTFDSRSSDWSGVAQGGSNADNVLADAYVKGVRGAVDWSAGYQALLADAENVPPNTSPDPRAPDSNIRFGRGALSDYKQYGYITPSFTRAVSRAIEYSVNDFSVYQVANGLGRTGDVGKYLNRSRNWRNHWNAQQTSLGFSGFVAPKFANGTFQYPYDPLQCGGCYWGDPFYEDNPWTYSFNAHHDIQHLIHLSGGKRRFVERLEKFFEPGVYNGNQAYGNTIFNPGNEPSFTTPYLFSFAGRQDLSVQYSRHVAKSYYGAGVNGLPGNSDAGAMQTWILWNMIGLYPITGQTTFLIGSPWFASLRIDLGSGKSLSITSSGGNADTAYHVQSLRVNGIPWNKNWVTWDDIFAKGGSLEFELGASPVGWAARGPPPPSPASSNFSSGNYGGALSS
ncbi:glycoside hydrolase family 92 protein [Polychaeton citri CBS 116435]|uniref:Glycoside hydrolase family 92 protein n=1 Tax=Polychaeton citri CBS 116435 TaxID=1314669 RepID=A0A9P4UQT1_9PEZI|nr:glycoside hydrolase family 92 protein [Polychaeton citri CBS 116435]